MSLLKNYAMHVDPDDLRFERSLGYGSYSEVNLYTHLPTNTLYAVKCISKKRIAEFPDILYCSAKEYSIVTACEHSNIIKFYSVFHMSDSLCFAIEYCSGGDLFQYVDKVGTVPLIECKRIVAQLLDALEYLHFKRKVVHGDIKPENIVLDRNGSVKLVDFGSASEFEQFSTDSESKISAIENLYGNLPKGNHYRYIDENLDKKQTKNNLLIKCTRRILHRIKKTASTVWIKVKNFICKHLSRLIKKRHVPAISETNFSDNQSYKKRAFTLYSNTSTSHLDDADITTLCDDIINRSEYCGTIDYMPPEMLLSSQLSVAGDIWSVGCILCFLLSGHPPFEGDTNKDVVQNILSYSKNTERAAVLRKKIPKDVVEFVEMFLEPSVEKRMKIVRRGGYSHLKKHNFFTS